MEPYRRSLVDAAIFGIFALLAYFAGATAVADALKFRSWPLGLFGIGIFAAAGLLTYETSSLAFGWPTLSLLTNQQFLSHVITGLIVIGLVGLVYGALSGHFTVNAGRFDPRVAAIVTLTPLAGYLVAVLSGWRVL